MDRFEAAAYTQAKEIASASAPVKTELMHATVDEFLALVGRLRREL
jgi:hypothetical protein